MYKQHIFECMKACSSESAGSPLKRIRTACVESLSNSFHDWKKSLGCFFLHCFVLNYIFGWRMWPVDGRGAPALWLPLWLPLTLSNSCMTFLCWSPRAEHSAPCRVSGEQSRHTHTTVWQTDTEEIYPMQLTLDIAI